MAKLTGKAKITIDGDFIDTFKGVKFNSGGVKRTPVTSAHSVGFTEELTPATLEIEKTQVRGDSIKDLDISDATIQIEWDTGQVYVMPHAFRLDPADLGDDGKSKYVFNSEPAEEVSVG
ncbi:phage tail tube family protein [Asticcacaulis biprosthecium C19]|uniref:Phage tail tube family protein n=1 Tax=Asticcacaulis biprosthecium C19 TaxID=715226 RepID=F4QG93_9CAUL|nr:phage tail tube protein [Asticcacaulis biprosthecium]EGF92421.1 phage tail tube family protein [Asticcacaulis biprosthecium C19]